LLKAVPVRTVADDTFDDVFHRIFIEKIEPRLDEYAEGRPVLVCDYPPSMSALARLNSAGFADRFEVYWRGLELCNAFHELNDPSENRRRFERDNVMKASTGREQVPLDVQLLRSFDNGIPPAGGIALGLERLFMATRSLSSIDQVRPF
jgi:lysyl-tRNA synthetase class 2